MFFVFVNEFGKVINFFNEKVFFLLINLYSYS